MSLKDIKERHEDDFNFIQENDLGYYDGMTKQLAEDRAELLKLLDEAIKIISKFDFALESGSLNDAELAIIAHEDFLAKLK